MKWIFFYQIRFLEVLFLTHFEGRETKLPIFGVVDNNLFFSLLFTDGFGVPRFQIAQSQFTGLVVTVITIMMHIVNCTHISICSEKKIGFGLSAIGVFFYRVTVAPILSYC